MFLTKLKTLKIAWIKLPADFCRQPSYLLGETIEIGLEQAPFLFFNFFSAFEHVNSLLIMGPNNTKNSSLKCDFLIINYE